MNENKDEKKHKKKLDPKAKKMVTKITVITAILLLCNLIVFVWRLYSVYVGHVPITVTDYVFMAVIAFIGILGTGIMANVSVVSLANFADDIEAIIVRSLGLDNGE